MKDLKDMSLAELWELFPIILKSHNPNYKLWYEQEKQSILSIADKCDVIRINHIGSTAVEGLLAKPIVDILLELPLNYAMDGITLRLQGGGWVLMRQEDSQKTLSFNKGYTPKGFAEKVFHLHVRPAGDWGELYFRDYLQSNPEVSKQYEQLKISLLKQYQHNRDAYTEAKTKFVTQYTQKAREEFLGCYLPAKRE